MTKQVCTKLAKLNEQRLRNRVTTGIILLSECEGTGFREYLYKRIYSRHHKPENPNVPRYFTYGDNISKRTVKQMHLFGLWFDINKKRAMSVTPSPSRQDGRSKAKYSQETRGLEEHVLHLPGNFQ